eukprot:jgi/Tetstr1/439342/TSEL_027780.t1
MNNLPAANDYPPAVSIQVSKYAAVAIVIIWRGRGIFDPWAGHKSTPEALRPCGATVLNNDFSLMYLIDLCEDAFEPFMYQCARPRCNGDHGDDGDGDDTAAGGGSFHCGDLYRGFGYLT